jgi:hypothetical protein
LIGYARCSLDKQDLTAQSEILLGLGVAEGRIHLDHGLTGTNRDRPGLDQALAGSGPATPSSYRSSTGSPARCLTPVTSATPSPSAT